MFDRTGLPPKHEEARGVSRFGRSLRDESRRKVVVELGGLHAAVRVMDCRVAPIRRWQEG
jgi:hypothetical protein